jgi:hypothetical protein
MIEDHILQPMKDWVASFQFVYWKCHIQIVLHAMSTSKSWNLELNLSYVEAFMGFNCSTIFGLSGWLNKH